MENLQRNLLRNNFYKFKNKKFQIPNFTSWNLEFCFNTPRPSGTPLKEGNYKIIVN